MSISSHNPRMPTILSFLQTCDKIGRKLKWRLRRSVTLRQHTKWKAFPHHTGFGMGCGYGGGHWERIDAKWENIFRLFLLNIRRFGGLLSLPHPWSLYHRRVFIRQEMMPIRKQSAFGNLNALWDRVPP